MALLGRVCGWTRADLAEFTPHALADIVKEVARQVQEKARGDFLDHCWPIAQLAALMANIHRDEKKKPDLFTLQDFMPRFKGEPEKEPETKPAQTPEQMLMIVRALNAQMGGIENI